MENEGQGPLVGFISLGSIECEFTLTPQRAFSCMFRGSGFSTKESCNLYIQGRRLPVRRSWIRWIFPNLEKYANALLTVGVEYPVSLASCAILTIEGPFLSV